MTRQDGSMCLTIKKIKEKKLEDLLNKKMVPVPGQPKTKPKKKKQKLTDKQKKNVDKDAIIMEKEDIPGTPHFFIKQILKFFFLYFFYRFFCL